MKGYFVSSDLQVCSPTPEDGMKFYPLNAIPSLFWNDREGLEWINGLIQEKGPAELSWTVTAQRNGETLTKTVVSCLRLKSKRNNSVLGYVLIDNNQHRFIVDLAKGTAKDWSLAREEVDLSQVPVLKVEEALFGRRTRDNQRANDGGLDFAIAVSFT